MRNSLLITAAVLATLGCNSQRQPAYAALGLVEVSGKVTMDGEPLANANVAFENPETRTFSIGATNAAGLYKLMFNSEKSGCTPGRKVVRISPYRPTDSDPDEAPPPGSKIPEKYNRKSELAAEVDSSHRTFDFDLHSR